ncbi:YceI family protein [Ancylomarina salipaludis]|uniref:YceI family protein n=1 Tax=Ancylomarina salipaludis TaxID=2501299 RepID=A0A4V1MZV5_9BACT|nr:YceI family protein [Ancylomarina salipaludis]RXQ89884.1 YceI family protein [Ancylomarina salipaludis]
MKKIGFFILMGFMLINKVDAKLPVKNVTAFKVQAKESKVYWTGKKVSGKHTGEISLKNGEIVLNGEKFVSANINIDMSSIVCTDLSNEEWNKKLIGHLKSDDFFSTEKFPESNFKTTQFIKIQNAKSDEANYTVKGILSIKGISQEISFPAKIDWKDNELWVDASLSVDRTKWDIKYGSGSFFDDLGDNMIHDKFEIKFQLVSRVN